MSSYGNAQAIERRPRRALVVLLAFITLMTAACGSDATETAEADGPAAETNTEPEESEPEASPEDLLGRWLDARFTLTWQIEADSLTASGEANVESSYSATSTTLEVTDISGVRACAPNLVGIYEWAIVDDLLTLTVLSEQCSHRRDALDGRRFTRQEPEPEPEESESGASPEDLLGTWSNPDFGVTWQIEAASIIVTGGVIDEASYSATGTTLELTDVSGERACAPNLVGVYEWAIVDDLLTLTLISDECEGRGNALDGRWFTRQ